MIYVQRRHLGYLVRMIIEQGTSIITEQKHSVNYARETDTTIQHIVIVDDDKDDIFVFDQALREINDQFKLHFALSGDQMFELLQQFTPDLIFLDLHMPGKSGIACLKMLRYNKIYEDVPVIIYSKLDKQSFIDDCYESKANYYIIKPVTFEKIRIAINEVISNDWEAQRYPAKEDFVIR